MMITVKHCYKELGYSEYLDTGTLIFFFQNTPSFFVMDIMKYGYDEIIIPAVLIYSNRVLLYSSTRYEIVFALLATDVIQCPNIRSFT